MNKRKATLRGKIKNRAKSRKHSTKKRRTALAPYLKGDDNQTAARNAEEGLEVMSQVILDFAGPLLETCTDEASERKALSLAIFVWNATLLPESEQRRFLEGYLAECQKVIPPEELNRLSAYIDQLVETKKTRLADNRKKITNCTFGDFGQNRHLEVGYTLE